MIDYKGKLSILLVFPVVGQMVGMIDIPGLTAQVAALAKLVVDFKPPSIAAGLEFAANLTAQLQAAATPPSLQISAELVAKLALFKARLELILKIVNLLTGGSVRVYEYDGLAGSFGPELTTTLAGADADGGVSAGQSSYALVLLAEAGSSGEIAVKAMRAGV